MKKTTPKKSIKIMFFILMISYCGVNMYGQNIYVNDMDYVLGDTKQRFINGQVTSQAEADNLLKGFKTMKVNGIRVPIFATNKNPNKPIMQYFVSQAILQGFDIFANPAQGEGGHRVALGILNDYDPATVSVRDDADATTKLVNTVLQFSLDYPGCKWLNPLNEDGQTTATFSAMQTNEIYSRIHQGLIDANTAVTPELVGPCVWGIPASIEVLTNTTIGDYITVATTHNLGFNHGRWPEFITLAGTKNLPVWDSEVNNGSSNGSLTRIDAAIANNVDGLVIYNSGNTISLSTGSIGGLNEIFMSKYLKPLTNLASNANAMATQSSTQLEASRAIDGDISGSFNGGNGSIALTTDETTDPWWQVDLGSNETIGHVKVFGRTDSCCRARLSDYTVTIINSGGIEVFSLNLKEYPDQATVIETGGVVGQVVKIQQHTDFAMALAEVQVFAEAPQQLSIEDIDKKDVKVSMYPNPVNDKLTIMTPNANFNNYVLYNINGQVVLTNEIEGNVSELEINVSELSRGFYVIRLNGDNFSGSYKVVKD